MNNGIVIRLAGVEQPATRILQQDVITIGTAPDCDLVIGADDALLPPESVLLTLRRRDGAYRLTTVEPMAGITRDGEAVAIGETIQDGDTLYFGATGIRLRFFSLTETESITGSLRLGSAVLASARTENVTVTEAARHKRLVPRTDVAIVSSNNCCANLSTKSHGDCFTPLLHWLLSFFYSLFIFLP